MKKFRSLREDIDYKGYPERMDPNLERKLSSPESLYARNPAFRRGQSDVEKLAGDRFLEVVDKLKEVSGLQDLTAPQAKAFLQREFMMKTQETIQIESRFKEQLEDIAKRAVEKHRFPKGVWYELDPRLNRSSIDVSDFRYEEENQMPNQDSDDEDYQETDDINQRNYSDEERSYSDLESQEYEDEEFNLEVAKREIENLLIQGYAKKEHYLFLKPDVKKELDALNPQLSRNYNLIMAINDYLYFTMDDMIEMMSRTGSGVAGKVHLEDTPEESSDMGSEEDDFDSGEENQEKEFTPVTKIVGEGLIFPIVTHELSKGVQMANKRHGYPEDPNLARKVLRKTEVLHKEPMELRLGPKIVDILRDALPERIFEEENVSLHNYFDVVMSQVPAREYVDLYKDLIYSYTTNDKKSLDRVKRTLEELLQKAEKMRDEFETDEDESEDNFNWDDLLGGTGVGRE